MGPAVAVQPQLRAGQLRSSAHAADGLRVRVAVRPGQLEACWPMLVKDWQINGIASWLSGRPFTIGGDNGLLQQQGGSQTINVTGDARTPGFGEAGPDEPWYDPSLFSQPGNAWGNTGRNAVPRTATWNLDSSVFRTIPFGHYHLELRAESQNVLNHPQWANPVTGFTDPELHAHPQLWRGNSGQLGANRAGCSGREVRVLETAWAVAASATAHFFASFLLPASCFPLGIPGTIEGQPVDLMQMPCSASGGLHAR